MLAHYHPLMQGRFPPSNLVLAKLASVKREPRKKWTPLRGHHLAAELLVPAVFLELRGAEILPVDKHLEAGRIVACVTVKAQAAEPTPRCAHRCAKILHSGFEGR